MPSKGAEILKRLLVRADDLGYSEAVNYGIAKTVNDGFIRSVGVMTNMPTVKSGLALMKRKDLCLGLHTNICVGRPITDPALIPSITTESGEFKPSSEYRSAEEDFVNLDEVVLEIEAQYRRFKELTGEEPHYFEAHAVKSDNLFKGLVIVAERHNLPLLPCALDGPVTFRTTKMISAMEAGDPGYDPFETLKRLSLRDYGDDECPMMVCHPGWLDQYILTHSSMTLSRTKEADMLCDPAVKTWLDGNDIKLVTYDDIA